MSTFLERRFLDLEDVEILFSRIGRTVRGRPIYPRLRKYCTVGTARCRLCSTSYNTKYFLGVWAAGVAGLLASLGLDSGLWTRGVHRMICVPATEKYWHKYQKLPSFTSHPRMASSVAVLRLFRSSSPHGLVAEQWLLSSDMARVG
jgi:hypothetical protein